MACLNDDYLDIIKEMLPYVDLSDRDQFGRTVFDDIIPVKWSQRGIFSELIEQLPDGYRKLMILRSATSTHTAAGLEFRERYVLLYSDVLAQIS